MHTLYGAQRKAWLATLVLLPLVLLLAACTQLPSDIKQRSDALLDQIKSSSEQLTQQRADFEAMLSQEQYVFAATYSPQELHKDRFDQAADKLTSAQTLFDEQIKPLLDGFDESERAQLESQLSTVETTAQEAQALAADPSTWLARVADTKQNAPRLIENARTASNAIVSDMALLENDALTASQDFSAQSDQIKSKLTPLEALRDTALAGLSDIDTEASRSQPNFAVLATGLTTIEGSSSGYAEGAKTLRSDLADLSVTETHTLIDFRVDSFVEISRTSWNESLDFPTETDYDYPAAPVTLETANYFADRLNQLVAQISPGFFGGDGFQLEAGIEQARWDELKLDPKANWPDYDSMAEFTVSEIEDTYCQKLKVLRDGQPNESARPDPNTNPCSQYDTPGDLAQGIFWEETDEFDAEAIGMDIYSKAYGDFSDQATTAATPPGMAYVGDPATGEWRQDSQGNSFWYYYGQYAFFSQLIGGPQPYHYRSEYDTWNRDYRRNDQPYYAANGGTARYGASSPQVASRFPNSTFVKSGLDTATVRNAGPAARSGGPGNGGK